MTKRITTCKPLAYTTADVPKAYPYGAEAYLQTGKNNTGATKEGLSLGCMVGYKFLPSLSATMGIDYLSGNNTTDSPDKDKVFTPFSGTNHKFYGFMDYYYVSYTPKVGLLNPYISATIKTSEKGNLSATGHLLPFCRQDRRKNTSLRCGS